ncbi:MAG: IS5 family transposase [Verrucomicrobiia bacterium]
MQTTSDPQYGLLDSLMPSAPANDFLERLDRAVDFKPIEAALHRMYPARTGHPPHPPLVLFKMSLLQHCYGLSDPQCEELVADRMSWRRFVGLGLQDRVPDETTLVRFRQRLMEHGLHEKLLQLVNRQLEQKGFILKTCTLVDATLLAAARRAPAREDRSGGDDDAGFTVKKGQPHYGYKAHVAADQEHTLIRQVTLSDASVHDSQEFENVVKGDEEMVVADKAYWSQERSRWCERRNIGNGILRKAFRGQPLDKTTLLFNRLMSRVRCGIERIFGWWKRCTGYRRVRYVGRDPNRLELEFKSICWNLKRLVSLTRA